MKKIYKNLEEYILCTLLVIIVCVSGIQVAARYVLNNSLSWSEELCRYLYVWTGFITISFTVKRASIIKIDTVIMFLPKTVQKVLAIITTCICFAVVALLLKNAVIIVSKTMTSGQLSAAMEIPMWWVYLGPAVGFALTEIRLVERFISLLKPGKEENK